MSRDQVCSIVYQFSNFIYLINFYFIQVNSNFYFTKIQTVGYEENMKKIVLLIKKQIFIF